MYPYFITFDYWNDFVDIDEFEMNAYHRLLNRDILKFHVEDEKVKEIENLPVEDLELVDDEIEEEIE